MIYLIKKWFPKKFNPVLESLQSLNDKKIYIKERFDLAHKIWKSNIYNFIDKDQIIIDWFIGLVTNKRK